MSNKFKNQCYIEITRMKEVSQNYVISYKKVEDYVPLHPRCEEAPWNKQYICPGCQHGPTEDGCTISINGKDEMPKAVTNDFYPEHLAIDIIHTRNGDKWGWRIKHNPNKKYIYIDLANRYSVYTFDTDFKEETDKIMNLLAHGHAIKLVTAQGKIYKLGIPSPKFLDTQICKQLRYITGKYAKVTNKWLSKYMVAVFGPKDANGKPITEPPCVKARKATKESIAFAKAKEVLATKTFDKEVEASDRYIVLKNIIRNTLIDIEQDRMMSEFATTQMENMQHIPEFKTEIPKEAWELLPNQEVTPRYTQAIDVEWRASQELLGNKKETTGFYVSKGRSWKIDVAPADRLEAQAVNAWYYSHEEFRIPSREDMMEELEILESQFESLKKEVKTADPLTRDFIIKSWAPSYSRMLELQDLVGEELHGKIENKAIDIDKNDRDSSDYELQYDDRYESDRIGHVVEETPEELH